MRPSLAVYLDEMCSLVSEELRERVVIPFSPLILDALTVARDRNSDQVVFRKALNRIGRFMAYEISRELGVEVGEVETPLAKARGFRLAERLLIVEVLRAAIPFVEGMLSIFEDADVGIVSAHRGPPPDFKIDVSYSKVPPTEGRTVIVADPMLATGNTLIEVTRRGVMRKGWPRRLIFATVVSCPQGIEKVLNSFPASKLYTAAIDPLLNEKGYIVPGLGDAGDRCFGSEEAHPIQ